LFALAGHLRGSFLLKITSLVAWISAQGITKRRTFFIAKKYTKNSSLFLPKDDTKRHQVSPGRTDFFFREKSANSIVLRQGHKVFASQSSASIERLQTYRPTFASSLWLLESSRALKVKTLSTRND